MSLNGNTLNGLPIDDEEQYQLWLRDPGAQVVHLVEMDYIGMVAGSPGTRTVLLSDRPYPPAHPVVAAIPSFMRAIGDDFAGAVSLSIGSLVLNNATGALDSWLLLNIDGQRVRIRHGAPDWPQERFRTAFTCIAESISSADASTITVRLRAPDYGANGQIQSHLIGGSGPNANKPIPLAYGEVFNVEPLLTDAATLEYQWHDGVVQSVDAVRDSGIDFQTASKTISAVTPATDTLTTSAAHGFLVDDRVRFTGTPPAPLAAATDYWVIAAGLTTTDFRLSATRGGSAVDITGSTTGATCIGYHWTAILSTGKVLLSSAPSGQLTLDGKGYAAAGYVEDMRDILPLVLGTTNVMQARPSIYSNSSAVAMFVRDRRNRLDVAAELCSGSGIWYGYDRDQQLCFGRVFTYPPSEGLAIAEAELRSALTVERMVMPRDTTAATQGHRIGYARNWTVQSSGLAAAVDASHRALYGAAQQDLVNLVAPGTAHALAVVPDAPPAVFAGIYADGYALAEANRKNELFSGWGVVFGVTLGRVGVLYDIGRAVTLTHSRFGLSAGVAMTIVKVEDRPSEGLVKLSLFVNRGTYSPGAL